MLLYFPGGDRSTTAWGAWSPASCSVCVRWDISAFVPTVPPPATSPKKTTRCVQEYISLEVFTKYCTMTQSSVLKPLSPVTAKLDCQTACQLQSHPGIPGCVSVGYGRVALRSIWVPWSLPLHCSPAVLPKCLELSSFALPTLLSWCYRLGTSPPWTEPSKTMSQSKPLLFIMGIGYSVPAREN